MPSPVIHVSGLRKAYGRTIAVDDVSFDVQPGDIFEPRPYNGFAPWPTLNPIKDRVDFGHPT